MVLFVGDITDQRLKRLSVPGGHAVPERDRFAVCDLVRSRRCKWKQRFLVYQGWFECPL